MAHRADRSASEALRDSDAQARRASAENHFVKAARRSDLGSRNRERIMPVFMSMIDVYHLSSGVFFAFLFIFLAAVFDHGAGPRLPCRAERFDVCFG